MKLLRYLTLLLAMLFVGVMSVNAHAQSVTGSNSSTSAANTNSSSSTQNVFTSPGEATEHYNYSGQYTVKQNASVGLGSFAPSMSGYNCSATAQAGGSQANGGITAVFGFPVLLDPGMLCVYFTAANQLMQQASAVAPVDKVLALHLIGAAVANTCLVGEVYEASRVSMRTEGVDCPLGATEKKIVDKNVEKQYRQRDQSKPFVAGVDMDVEDQICGDGSDAIDTVKGTPSAYSMCRQHVYRRMKWKEQEINTPES